MAVFVSASDETGGPNRSGKHTYGGYVLSELDWSDWFAPAWDERVLAGPPRIPYLHMTEIRSRKWRESHGITPRDAENRVDEAIRVIRSMGALYPVTASVSQPEFYSSVSAALARQRSQLGPLIDTPDYMNFIWYALDVLDRAPRWFRDVEKIDFLVERNGRVTNHIKQFHGEIASVLESVSRSDLAPLVGELIPGGKDRVPLQAADVFCWHLQRVETPQYDSIDRRRLKSLIERKGHRPDWPPQALADMADSYQKQVALTPGTALLSPRGIH